MYTRRALLFLPMLLYAGHPSENLSRFVELQRGNKSYGGLLSPRIHSSKSLGAEPSPVQKTYVDGFSCSNHSFATYLDDNSGPVVTFYADNLILRTTFDETSRLCTISQGVLFKSKFKPVTNGKLHDFIALLNGQSGNLFDKDVNLKSPSTYAGAHATQESVLDLIMQQYEAREGRAVDLHKSISAYKRARRML